MPEAAIFRNIDIHDIDPNQRLRGLGYGESALIGRFLRHYEQVLEATFPCVRLKYEWKLGPGEEEPVVYCDCPQSVVPCSHQDELLYALSTDELYLKALDALDKELT